MTEAIQNARIFGCLALVLFVTRGLGLEGWPCVKTMVLQNENVAIYIRRSGRILLPSFGLLSLIAVCEAIYNRLF